MKIILFLLTLSSFAQQDYVYDKESQSVKPNFIGQVTLSKGRPKRSQGGSSNELKLKDKVYLNDIISTNKKSYVKLALVDTSEISIAPNSEVFLKKWVYERKDKRDAIFKLIHGKMRNIINIKYV